MTDTLVPVAELREGDFVDLEGDLYADPRRNQPALALNYHMVESIDRQTPAFLLVRFPKLDSYGFPASHAVKILPRHSAS